MQGSSTPARIRPGFESGTWKHKIISSRADLTDWLAFEQHYYRKRCFLDPFFTITEEGALWRYQKRLRRTEYYLNTKKKLRYLMSFALLNRLKFRFGMNIRLNSCGRGLHIEHVGPCITNGDIGENFRIFMNCAVVSSAGHKGKTNSTAVIGNGVTLFTGAVISGNVEIADRITIGANAVVTKSFTEPGRTIAGVPAREID